MIYDELVHFVAPFDGALLVGGVSHLGVALGGPPPYFLCSSYHQCSH